MERAWKLVAHIVICFDEALAGSGRIGVEGVEVGTDVLERCEGLVRRLDKLG